MVNFMVKKFDLNIILRRETRYIFDHPDYKTRDFKSGLKLLVRFISRSPICVVVATSDLKKIL